MKKHVIIFISFILFFLSSCSWHSPAPQTESSLYYAKYMELSSGKDIAREKLPKPEATLNNDVKKELKYFLKEDRKFILHSLNNKRKFEPMMRKAFEDQGVPSDLIAVALIESKYEPNAVSRSGAVGMWQFMKTTGEIYGLSVNLLEDQRRDPVLSTIAAAKHLKDLYMAYKDWYLALAAYNSGTGNVNRTIKKAQSNDFWEIKSRFREQTQRYVAKFVAANIILNSPEYWGFKTQ